jgi:MFS family permease
MDLSQHVRHRLKLLTWVVLLCLSTMGFTIQAFFAPTASTHMHLTHQEIGVVFALFPIGYISVSALFATCHFSHGQWSSVKLAISIRVCVGVVVLAAVLFGLTPTIVRGGSPTALVALFSLSRGVMGAATAAMDVFVLLYVMRLFPDDVGHVVGEWQSVMGMGVVLGPPLGGYLFEVFGFAAPQLIVGGATFVVAVGSGLYSCSVSARHVAPSPLAAASEDSKVTPRSAMQFVRYNHPACVASPLLGVLLAIASFTFFESMGPLLFATRLGVSPSQIGLCMALAAVAYAAIAILVGRGMNHAAPHFMAAGVVAGVTGLGVALAVFPSAWVHFGLGPEQTTAEYRAAAIVAAVLLGIFLAVTAVSEGSLTVTAAKAWPHHAASKENMLPVAGALSNTCQSLGGILGPLLGSHAVAVLGWPAGCAAMGAFLVFAALCHAVLLTHLTWFPSARANRMLSAMAIADVSERGPQRSSTPASVDGGSSAQRLA